MNLICRGKTESGRWIKGYPHFSDNKQSWHIHDIENHQKVHNVIEKSIGRYVGKIGNNDVFVGDIMREVLVEAEWQTHTGDNIPNGSYTEQIGTIIRYNYFEVPQFTIDNLEEIMGYFLYKRIFDKFDILDEFGVGNDELEDVVSWINSDLGTNAKSIDGALSIINEVKLVGNMFDNPELAVKKRLEVQSEIEY